MPQFAGKKIKEQEVRGLASDGNGNVIGIDAPPKYRVEEFGKGFEKTGSPPGSIVITQQFLDGPGLVHQFLHASAPNGFHVRNMSGIASAHHDDVASLGQGLAEVLHHFVDA